MSDDVAILIAGPTASGKSALAVELARACGGIVVNADSMQVYRELAVVTARPTTADMGGIPHRLYGHVAAGEAYSVARWLDDVRDILGDARSAGRTPVIVGGTGLYFRALLEGLSPVPAIDPHVRAAWRGMATTEPAPVLHDHLRARDPVMAARLSPGDTQRIVRALEVVDATGVSLATWQGQPGVGLLRPERTARLVLRPDRDWLYARCDTRFDVMMATGALDEVAALGALGLDPALPAMRALGVPPLLDHVAGRIGLTQAVDLAKTQTRHYAKRQTTWLKRYMIAWIEVNAQQNISQVLRNFPFIRSLR